MFRKAILRIALFAILLSAGAGFCAGQPKSPLAKGAQLVKLHDGFTFTEGPACDSKGNVYFTDQPNNRIWIWTVDGELTLFTEKSGRANGLYFDRQGVLWGCADQNNELWSYDKQGNPTVYLSDGYNGKRMNGPNDLWIAPNGVIYMSDPYFKRRYWTHDGAKLQDSEQVYRLSADRKQLVRVTDDLVQPNGLIGTPDGKQLYVADMKDEKTWRYTIQPDGSLGEKTFIAGMGSDGMTLDEEGNIYLTGRGGVTIFSKKGEKIGEIPIAGNWTANITFGGKDNRTLFITASNAIYSIRTRVKGAR